nr:hypothetical protein [uncultured Methanoregula sp.]
MKKTTMIMAGMICMICLAMLAPAVSAADLVPFNRSTVKAGDAFYSGSTIVTTPEGATFSQPVTISFILTQDQWKQALDVTNGNTKAIVVAGFDEQNATWSYLGPTSVSTAADGRHVVAANTTHTGMFSVFYIVVPLDVTPGPTPNTFGNMVGATPAATSAAASPAATGTAPAKAQAAPTQSPTLPGLAVIGVIGAVGFIVARRKF